MTGQNPFAYAFAPPTGAMAKVLPKITRADMGLHLPRLDDACIDSATGLQDPNKKRALDALIEKCRAIYVVGGQIVSTKATKGKGDEPGVRFVGQFKALVHPAFGGAIYISARCHVPKFFEEVLYTNVINAQKVDASATLEFLVGVGLKPPAPGKPSITGYEWTVEPLVDMSAADDPVDALFSRAKDRVALAAPSTIATAQVAGLSTGTEPGTEAPVAEKSAPENGQTNDANKETPRGRGRHGSHASS